jgi:hypothetical protein
VPFQAPRETLSPQAVAEAVLNAYREGHRGNLDL